MWFRNLTLFRLQETLELAPEELQEQLAVAAFQPCLSQELGSRGWVPPMPGDGLVHVVAGSLLICLQAETRVLPAAVVRDVLTERLDEIESREQRQVRGAEKSRLRDEIMLDLLPRAFTQRRQDHAYLDQAGGWLVVNGAGGKAVGELTARLRNSLGSLPITPPMVEQAPAAVMTGWLRDGQLPDGLVAGDECELRDAEGVVRCKGQDLAGDEIQAHIAAGKQVTRLALSWDERLAFVLGEDLSIRRLRFLDVIQEQLARVETDDAAALLDAQFALMVGELREWLPRLMGWFGGPARRI